MRIAHVTATFPPYYGGTGTVCYYNALGLARLGHEVTVLTSGGTGGEGIDPPGVTVHRLPAAFRIGNVPFAVGLLELRGFDVVHLHHPFVFGAEMVSAACRARRIPYVLTHHNDLIGDGGRRFLFDVYSALAVPWVFRGASKFAVVSLDHAANCRLAPLFQKRWADVVEVPNGVDVDLFRPGLDGRAVRRRHGIPEDARVVLFVGALDRAHHYRRLDVLMQAVAAFAAPDVYLVVVGDGDRMGSFRALSRRLNLEARSRFLGSRAERDLPPIYCTADVVVLPSALQESFGLVLLEAMACGKPVIASNLPGVRSVVSDGVDGLLVRPGDAGDLANKVQALLESPQQRKEMGEQGRSKVEQRYAWPAIISRLVRIYEEVR